MSCPHGFATDTRDCVACNLREAVAPALKHLQLSDFEQPAAPGGLRYNADKARMSLLSPWAQEGKAAVATFGAKKYAPWNWAKGLSWSETLDSLERHLVAFKKGEELDPDSGLPHIDHIQWNAMALSHFQKTATGTDDRWKKPLTKT